MPRPLRLAGWYPAHADRIVESLCDWIAIPSVAALPRLGPEVAASARFASRHMHAAGLRRATVLDTVAAPAAYAEWNGAGDSAPTVLVIGHLDVVPAAPLAEWTSPPFEGRVTPSAIIGRGTVDGKGAALAAIESFRGLIETGATPHINLKFLIHGDETIGSAGLTRLLEAEPDRFAADIVVVPVAGAGHRGATVVAGTRGLVLVDFTVRTADHDAATANYGGAIANPVLVASRIVAELVDPGGRVTLPGFYHRVRDLSPRGRKVLADTDFDETEWRGAAGARVTTGESGYSALERLVARPSADVVSFTAGNRSNATKTIVPGEATMRLAFGLVPDQRSDEVVSALRSWIEARLPRGVESELSIRAASRPTVGPIGHPAFSALLAASERVHRSTPVLSRHGGPGAPDVVFDVFTEQPVLVVPVGDATSRVNAPDEQLARQHLADAVHTFAELWTEIESLGSPR